MREWHFAEAGHLFVATFQLVTHTILDVVVDDEVEFLFCKAVVLGQDFVDFVGDGSTRPVPTDLLFNHY